MISKTLSPHSIGASCAIAAAFLFSTKAIFIKQAYALSPLVDATLLMALRMASALPLHGTVASVITVLQRKIGHYSYYRD